MSYFKRIILITLAFILAFTCVCSAEISLKSPSAILVDGESGLTLFEKNSQKLLPQF